MESSQLSDHERELQAFLESKSGVKEIADSRVSKIPTIFIHPPEELHQYSISADQFLQIPLIDLQGIRASPHDHQRRKEVAKVICLASETWGFFRIVNHGVPVQVLENVLGAVRTFHEQPKETKMEFNTNDFTRPFRIHRPVSYRKSTSAELWRDTFMCLFGDDHNLDFDAIPPVSRGGIMEYTKFVIELKKILAELMSEGLGLGKDFLARMDCMNPTALSCHYYPACPQPELTLGTGKHSDQSCLTILLQDSIGGLQILHQNHWVDVPHLPGALIVNVGEVMQFITNDKFRSVEHRVVAKQEGPRISVASFFSPNASNGEILYGPIKELLSEDDPPKYMEVTFNEYMAIHTSKSRAGYSSPLPHLKLSFS